MTTYVIAASRPGYERSGKLLGSRLKQRFVYIGDKRQLTLRTLRRIQPRTIFFPHWSYLIPAEIYENFECVIFHMTDLPFGRGGSPLQNLISRGIYKTKMTALRCAQGLDAGPIYMKRPLSLDGSAEEIYARAARLVEEMMADLIRHPRRPVPQKSRVTSFKRRKPSESAISHLSNLKQVYDYIRMLDAQGYPSAFLETSSHRYEFKNAVWTKGSVNAHVKITQK